MPPPSLARCRSHLSRPRPHARPAANYTSQQEAARARARGPSAMATVLSRALKLPGKESADRRPLWGGLTWGEGRTRLGGAWLLSRRAAALGGREGSPGCGSGALGDTWGLAGTPGDSRGRDCWRRAGPCRGRRGATVTIRSESLSSPSPREGRPPEHPSLSAGTRCCDLGLDQRGSRGLQDCN